MTGLAALFGEARSLRRRLVVNILLAVGFCFALASVILTYEFYEHLAENRDEALAREAAEIAGQITRKPIGEPAGEQAAAALPAAQQAAGCRDKLAAALKRGPQT